MSIKEAKIMFSILAEYRADMPYPNGKALLLFTKKRKSNTCIRDAVSYSQLQ